MITIFLGAPGTGKGTVATALKNKHHYKHISTGDLFREITRSGTPLGNEVKAIIESGNLITDEMTNKVLVEGLKKFDTHKDTIILDGYPRTIPQAEFLDHYLTQHNLKVGKVILLDVSEDILLKRISGRISCKNCGASFNTFFKPPMKEMTCDVCGHTLIHRADDAADKVKVRLETYYKLTAPLVDYYKKQHKLITIHANKEENALTEEVKHLIESH